MGSYEPPLDQLLSMGDAFGIPGEGGQDYLSLGIGPEQIPDLIRMAVDFELDSAIWDRPEGFAPMHAWKALAQLRSEDAIPTLVGLVAAQGLDDYDDWVTEEMPEAWA